MTLPEGNIDSRACRLRAFWPTLACALAFCAACMLAFLWTPVAYAEGEEASGDQSAEAQNTSIKSQEAPDTQDAIASCVAGLFASWNVQDAPAFYATDMLDVQDGTCMWFAFDAYRAGLTSGADVLLDRAATYVTEAYAGDDKGLDAYAPTTWGRTILVVGTLGGNPTEFGKKPDGSSANLVSDGVFNWSYTDDLGEQGSNAWIYTLQAVDALQLEAPAEAKYSNKDLVEGVLACQAKDGSFALGAGSATGSVDLTGMALAALAPHKDDVDVSKAIDDGIAYLSKQQSKDGTFAAEGESTSESCAMVVIGLSACGIDVGSDERFVKGGNSLLDALLSFQKSDGTFAHLRDDLASQKVQELPTEQALRALLAYEELAQGGDGNVYSADISLQVEGLSDQSGAPAQDSGGFFDVFRGIDWGMRVASLGIGVAAGLVVVAGIWAVRKVRRKAKR